MLPSNVDDPRFGESPAEPLAARMLGGVADRGENIVPSDVPWQEFALEFVARCIEHLAWLLSHR
jgi:hypothetical protein